MNPQQIKLPDGVDPSIAYFKTCKATRGGRNILLSSLLADIRNGKWQEQITRLRGLEYGSDDYSREKKTLPCVMLSASTATGGHRAADIGQHSGLLQIDVDGLSSADAVALRNKLASDPHLLATWLSPSARGVKGIICIPESVEGHLRAFECARSYFNEKYGVTIDTHCKDPCRLCFVSHDPDIRINASCVPLPLTEPDTTQPESTLPPTRNPTTQKQRTPPSHKNSTTSLPPASCVLPPAYYITRERLFDEFPLLKPFYQEHVTNRVGKPQKGVRNEALKELVAWLVYVVHPRFVTAFTQAFYCEHLTVFHDYEPKDFDRETESLLSGCQASYHDELNCREASSYAEMVNEDERTTFRVCRSLANSDSNPNFPPPLFFLSAEKLGARLGKLDNQAWRILQRFEKLGIIVCIKRGQKQAKGQDRVATVYRWLLCDIAPTPAINEAEPVA